MAKTSRLRDQLYMLQGSKCFYCDRAIAPNDRSLEHIIADSIGGFANDENAVVVCQDANHLLGDASPKRKMMMLKAGGGRIECPKLGACAKPTTPNGQVPSEVKALTHVDRPSPIRSTPSKPPGTVPTTKQANQPNATTNNNNGRNQRNQRNKSKKKSGPRLKSTSSVH